MFRRTFVCLLVVLAVVLSTATPALAAFSPREGSVFNWPRPWGTNEQRQRIVGYVDQAIDATRPTADDPNPIILITSYLMERKPPVDKLIAACKRGVSVRVILHEEIDNANAKRLVATLNADNVPDRDGDGVPDRAPRSGPCGRPLPDEPPVVGREGITDAQARDWVSVPTEAAFTWGSDRSYVKQCEGSCRGRGGNMHTKFYAFSNSGDARNVVMVSSSNLNTGGAVLGWNDMYVMTERPVSFAGYTQIHREMTDDSQAGDDKVELVDGPYTSRFYPMRRATRANDPVLKDLNRIGCRSSFGRTQVHVSMFGWRGTRGRYLADKLFSLKRQGCAVNIIFGAPSKKLSVYLRAGAKRSRTPLYNSRWDFNGDGIKEIRAHTKYVLVKGSYGGDNASHQVMTGSANWVDGGLTRGDESTLNIARADAYKEYLGNWNLIRRHSTRIR